ncbi:hypothetical protein ATANTOWER_005578, partial [Ataeniobius toweri]|nr:hypothetical protein [Ataeniobius toweri]
GSSHTETDPNQSFSSNSKTISRGINPVNMWDMQKDAELEDGEKAMVEELQKAFLVCCCSAGPQDASGTNETPTKSDPGGSKAM